MRLTRTVHFIGGPLDGTAQLVEGRAVAGTCRDATGARIDCNAYTLAGRRVEGLYVRDEQREEREPSRGKEREAYRWHSYFEWVQEDKPSRAIPPYHLPDILPLLDRCLGAHLVRVEGERVALADLHGHFGLHLQRANKRAILKRDLLRALEDHAGLPAVRSIRPVSRPGVDLPCLAVAPLCVEGLAWSSVGE